MGFRKDFVWGAATSAYQFEGAAFEDGKGLNIWDVYCREPGRVYGGHSGDIACDHYHRFREDIALMKEIGIEAYRFSINWARILPEGTGQVNKEGIAFYNNLIDELLEHGIEPYLTMYHWDLPYTLYQKGGWLNDQCVEWFGEYASVIAKNFTDRVRKIITFNEPQCFVGLGCLNGEQAPGLKMPVRDTFRMAHNVLKAHGNAVIRLREGKRGPIEIGYAPTCGMSCPASDSPEDLEAARQYLFRLPDIDDNWTWNVAWWSDPVFLGRYPKEGLEKYEAYLPVITQEDMALISQPLDFMCENIYNSVTVKASENGGWEVVERYDGFPKTAAGWPVTPECLHYGPKFLCERYGLPLYISENGISCHDVVSLDGRVHDPNRIDFMARYLKELEKASVGGADIRGYFYWSFMDNFEWSQGYNERFGLVHVDYRTQERRIKDSGYWYRDVIRTNGGEI